MNDSIITGKWRELKGEVQKAWGDLTSDELDRTQGNAQSLIGLLQQKFGYAKEEATSKINELVQKFEDRNGDKLREVSDKANSKIDNAKANLRRDDVTKQ